MQSEKTAHKKNARRNEHVGAKKPRSLEGSQHHGVVSLFENEQA
jgi:hypothetical protein